MTTSRDLAIERSGGKCEAMVRLGGSSVFARCGVEPVDVHHRLPRRRGGTLLDKELETHHLICLCRRHHNETHGKPAESTDNGLFLEGSAVRDGTRIVYTGPDRFLDRRYGKDANYEIRNVAEQW